MLRKTYKSRKKHKTCFIWNKKQKKTFYIYHGHIVDQVKFLWCKNQSLLPANLRAISRLVLRKQQLTQNAMKTKYSTEPPNTISHNSGAFFRTNLDFHVERLNIQAGSIKTKVGGLRSKLRTPLDPYFNHWGVWWTDRMTEVTGEDIRQSSNSLNITRQCSGSVDSAYPNPNPNPNPGPQLPCSSHWEAWGVTDGALTSNRWTCRRCRCMFDEMLKRRWQTTHANGRSPVWQRRWRVRFAERGNSLRQNRQRNMPSACCT